MGQVGRINGTTITGRGYAITEQSGKKAVLSITAKIDLERVGIHARFVGLAGLQDEIVEVTGADQPLGCTINIIGVEHIGIKPGDLDIVDG